MLQEQEKKTTKKIEIKKVKIKKSGGKSLKTKNKYWICVPKNPNFLGWNQGVRWEILQDQKKPKKSK